MFGRLGLFGLLVLAHEESGYFRLEHKLLLQAIAGQAAIAVENAQLYSGMAQEQQRMQAVLQNVADPILTFDGNGCLNLAQSSRRETVQRWDCKNGCPAAAWSWL